MSERIEQISKEAWRQVDVSKIRGRHRAYTKIFAELIVRECATVCADNGFRAGGGCTQVGEDLLLAAKLINKHFGVEE